MISLDYHMFDSAPVLKFSVALKQATGISREEAFGFLIRAVLYCDYQGRIPLPGVVVEVACGWTVLGHDTGRPPGMFVSAAVDHGLLAYDHGADKVSVANWGTWTAGMAIYYGPEWRLAKAAATVRDGRACRECGRTERLEVHHIRPLRSFHGNTAVANELSNLITLCIPCHAEADAKRRREESK